MPSMRQVLALLVVTGATVGSCKPNEPKAGSVQADAGLVRSSSRVQAGGVFPAANALASPRPGKANPDAGAVLFGAMNCDGCHGGGAVGWVGPSLVDGRWRYGGADEDIFLSIYYGRPKGMPAYGGVIGTDGVWMLVAYLKAQTLPTVVPTTSWLPGGNASPNPTPAPAAAAAPAAPVSKAPIPPDQLPARYGCTACHAVDHKVVGPAFRDVAARYKGKNVVDTLVAKVRKGGFGNWGQVPMVPNPAVPDQDLQRVVQWILALK